MFKKILGIFTDEYEEERMPNENTTNLQNKIPNMEVAGYDDGARKIVNLFGNTKKEESVGRVKVSHVSIIRPKTFEDARMIADAIKVKNVVTFSLEYLGFETGQRVIDFVFGTAHAMDAHLSKITDKVFTVIPKGVEFEDVDTVIEEPTGKKILL